MSIFNKGFCYVYTRTPFLSVGLVSSVLFNAVSGWYTPLPQLKRTTFTSLCTGQFPYPLYLWPIVLLQWVLVCEFKCPLREVEQCTLNISQKKIIYQPLLLFHWCVWIHVCLTRTCNPTRNQGQRPPAWGCQPVYQPRFYNHKQPWGGAGQTYRESSHCPLKTKQEGVGKQAAYSIYQCCCVQSLRHQHTFVW